MYSIINGLFLFIGWPVMKVGFMRWRSIPFLPSLPSTVPSLCFLFPPFPYPSFLLLPTLLPLPLEVGPFIQLGALGEHCKLPQRSLGHSPSRNWIWCILAIKSGIWWQQFSWELTDQIPWSLRSANRKWLNSTQLKMLGTRSQLAAFRLTFTTAMGHAALIKQIIIKIINCHTYMVDIQR